VGAFLQSFLRRYHNYEMRNPQIAAQVEKMMEKHPNAAIVVYARGQAPAG